MARRGNPSGDELPESDPGDAFGDAFDDDNAETGETEEAMDLVTVAQARNMKEARTMKSILESAEITALIGIEEGAAARGETPAAGIPVLVPEGMVVEAEEILAEAAMDADDEDIDDVDDEDWDDEDDEDDDLFDDLEDEDDDFDDDDDDDYDYDDDDDDDDDDFDDDDDD